MHGIYAGDHSVVSERYGSTLTRRALAQLELMPAVLKRIGTFPVIAATKSQPASPAVAAQTVVAVPSSQTAAAMPDIAAATAPNPQPTGLVPPDC